MENKEQITGKYKCIWRVQYSGSEWCLLGEIGKENIETAEIYLSGKNLPDRGNGG